MGLSGNANQRGDMIAERGLAGVLTLSAPSRLSCSLAAFLLNLSLHSLSLLPLSLNNLTVFSNSRPPNDTQLGCHRADTWVGLKPTLPRPLCPLTSGRQALKETPGPWHPSTAPQTHKEPLKASSREKQNPYLLLGTAREECRQEQILSTSSSASLGWYPEAEAEAAMPGRMRRKGGADGVSAGFVLWLTPQEVEDCGPLRQHLPARHPLTPSLDS